MIIVHIISAGRIDGLVEYRQAIYKHEDMNSIIGDIILKRRMMAPVVSDVSTCPFYTNLLTPGLAAVGV